MAWCIQSWSELNSQWAEPGAGSKQPVPGTALGNLPACMVKGVLLVAAASHRDIMEKQEKPLGAFLGVCFG